MLKYNLNEKMASPSFDLIDVIRIIQRNIKFILIITVVTSLAGLVVFFIKPKKYKAASRFLVNNPLYGDRTTLFRSFETRYVDYFGGDDDLDKVTALASSDTVSDRVIRNCQFQEVYKMDINDAKGHSALMGIYGKNCNLKRSEYKDIEISYTAYEPVTAANVANMTVKVLEETYRHYYTATKQNIISSIANELKVIDSTILKLTDSLAVLREQYGIYNIISPNRQIIINGEPKAGAKGTGKAIEEIQNLESIKDQLVTDRTHYISNMHEFTAAQNDAMQYLKVISRALPPTSPTGPSMQMTMLVGMFCGFFFSIIYVLLMAYYRLINTKEL